MRKNSFLRPRLIAAALFSAAALAAGILHINFWGIRVSAQAPGCPSYVRTSGNGWTEGQTVYLNFGNITDANMQAQIRRAVATWNTANQNNNSRVTFSFNAPPSSGSYTLTFQTGSTPNGRPANTNSTIVPATGNIIDATITFNLNATFNGNPRVYQPGQPGYDTIFEKVALHEIGHTMGLSHPEPHPDDGSSHAGESVMNIISGPNDRNNNEPRTIGNCDQNSVNSQSDIYHTVPGTTIGDGGDGGGTGGGTGGGDPTCFPQYVEDCGYDGSCDDWDPYTGTCTVYPGYDYCNGYWIDCP